jgi:hypothetical protein
MLSRCRSKFRIILLMTSVTILLPTTIEARTAISVVSRASADLQYYLPLSFLFESPLHYSQSSPACRKPLQVQRPDLFSQSMPFEEHLPNMLE